MDQLKYIISVLTELIAKSKTIGELETKDPGDNPEDAFVAIYMNTTGKTKKSPVNDLFNVAVGGIPAHTHSYLDISGIGDYKVIELLDTNDEPWSVIRSIDDVTGDSFKLNDIAKGYRDVAKTTFMEIVIIGATATIPVDLDDDSKVLILNEKIII